MALKSDRNEVQTDISFFMNEVATRGGIASLSTGGSGAAMDQGAALVTYAATASGKAPIGILLNDMVNLDLTRQHINQHKDEVQKGGKVTVLRKGYVVTNNIEGAEPDAGDQVFPAHSGNFSKADIVGDGTVSAIGRFLSGKDEDGYYKVEVNLP
jgi:hypothetical protein|tara:strand:+ start:1992 stop:2456 length:465 start_codon:yes stop_codon:yes gene_type:complete